MLRFLHAGFTITKCLVFLRYYIAVFGRRFFFVVAVLKLLYIVLTLKNLAKLKFVNF